MIPNSAMVWALAFYREPSRLRGQFEQPLPKDMLDIIRASAGDEDALAEYSLCFRTTAEEVQAAADLFLRRSMLSAGQNAYRMLSLPVGSSLEQVKLHKRWLLKWLHPDRNSGAWKTVLFNQVILAAKAVESHLANLPANNSNVTFEKPATSFSGYFASRHRAAYIGPIFKSKGQHRLNHSLLTTERRIGLRSPQHKNGGVYFWPAQATVKRRLQRYGLLAALTAATIFATGWSWHQMSLNRPDLTSQIARP